MSAAPAVTDASFDADVLKSGKPVLVDFWAEWCGPCRAVGPILDQIRAEHGAKSEIVKLNAQGIAVVGRTVDHLDSCDEGLRQR